MKRLLPLLAQLAVVWLLSLSALATSTRDREDMAVVLAVVILVAGVLGAANGYRSGR